MWEHKRDPWFFKSGGEGSGLYTLPMTVEKTWKKITEKEGFTKRGTGKNWCGHSPQVIQNVSLCLDRSEKKRTL